MSPHYVVLLTLNIPIPIPWQWQRRGQAFLQASSQYAWASSSMHAACARCPTPAARSILSCFRPSNRLNMKDEPSFESSLILSICKLWSPALHLRKHLQGQTYLPKYLHAILERLRKELVPF